MLRFSLQHLVSLVDRLECHDKLRRKILERALRGDTNSVDFAGHRRTTLESSAKQLEHDLQTAGRNMSVEEDEDFKQVIRSEYLRIKSELHTVRCELQGLPANRPVPRDLQPEQQVEAAMNLLNEIHDVAQNSDARSRIAPTMHRLGFEVGLRFVDGVKGRTRRVRRLAGGVVSIGGRLGQQIAERQNYSSSTPRDQRKMSIEADTAASKTPTSRRTRREEPSERLGEGISFTKENRGDRTAIELFLTGIRWWEAGLRRRFSGKLDDPGHS